MATLYRCITPTDWLCPCGRVARALRRHGVTYEEVRVPLRKRDRDDVALLSGQRHVPVLVLGGEAICDSHRIVEHLEHRAASARAGRPGAGRPGAGRPGASRPGTSESG